jgi:hypothetical protein
MSEPFWSEPTEASKAMNAWIGRTFEGLRGRTIGAVPPEHDRLAAALSEWERVKNLPDHDEHKMFAALQLEAATKAAEAARQEAERPRDEQGRYVSFDQGVRGRRTFQIANPQESANSLMQRALVQSRLDREAAEADPGHTIIANA